MSTQVALVFVLTFIIHLISTQTMWSKEKRAARFSESASDYLSSAA